MRHFEFDLIAIGAGSGGVSASRYAAAKGARVAICEEGEVGGTCVLRGCIPKKIFMYGSQLAEAFSDAAGYGWSGNVPTFDMSYLTAQKNRETARLEQLYRKLLADSGVTLLGGHAELAGPHSVFIDGRERTAGRILIATGSSPRWPTIPGIHLTQSSDHMLDLKTLPRQLLVLGSGYIAVELAGIFRGLGSEVTLAFRSDLPLRGFDADIRSRLATALVNRGVRLLPGFQPGSIEIVGKTTLCHGADGALLCAEIVLNAMGRIPNTHSLGLERLDVPIRNSAGAIHVDAFSRTAIQSIFAVGDVTDRLNLTPVAIAEARAFVDTEFGGKPRAIRHELAASAVFSQPQVASVGLSEERALEQKKRLKIFEADFRPLKFLLAGRNERTYMKLVTDADTEQVLGLHMLGSDAAEIVQSLAVAITAGIRKSDFDATMAVHPTAAEEFVLMRNPRPATLPA